MLFLRKCLFTHVSNFQKYNVHSKIKDNHTAKSSIPIGSQLRQNCILTPPHAGSADCMGTMGAPGSACSHNGRVSSDQSTGTGPWGLPDSVLQERGGMRVCSASSALVSKGKCHRRQEPLCVLHDATYFAAFLSQSICLIVLCMQGENICKSSHKFF